MVCATPYSRRECGRSARGVSECPVTVPGFVPKLFMHRDPGRVILYPGLLGNIILEVRERL